MTFEEFKRRHDLRQLRDAERSAEELAAEARKQEERARAKRAKEQERRQRKEQQRREQQQQQAAGTASTSLDMAVGTGQECDESCTGISDTTAWHGCSLSVLT